jgi:tetratricopeptide (TPR) repeat protein
MTPWVRGRIASFRVSENSTGLHLLLIVAVGIICYCNTFAVPFYFDDYAEIVNDPAITGDGSLWQLLVSGPRRVADFSFALNYKMNGLNVAGYHAVNLAIHISAALVLYALCHALLQALELYRQPDTPDADHTGHQFIPLAVSLLFICHPIQTQAVTYIVQRYASLAAFFYLGALLAFVKVRLSFEVHRFNRALYGWVILLFLTALLGVYTKPIVYSLPLMILMFEACLFRGRLLKPALTVACIVGITLFLAKTVPPLLKGTPLNFVLYDLRHASSVDIYSSRLDYFLTQSRVLITYFKLLIVPVGQRLDYDFPDIAATQNIIITATLALHATLAAVAVALQIRSKKLFATAHFQQAQALRLMALGIAWFYIAISVTSSFIPIPDDIAEHRMYLPSIGAFIVLAVMANAIGRKFTHGLRYQWAGLAVVCTLLALTTLARNNVWGDELRFWQNEVALSPRNGRVHANLGLAYVRVNKPEQALRSLVDGLKLDPDMEDAWEELGSILLSLNTYEGRFTDTDKYLTAEGTLDYRYYIPYYSNVFNNMGLANEFIGQPADALVWYRKSLTINPKLDLAWFNMGLLSLRTGNVQNATLAVAKLSELNSPLATKLRGSAP